MHELEEEEPTLRSSVPTFNIKDDCIFCSEAIAGDAKTPSKRRKVVSNVETIEFQETILNKATDRQDDWGNVVGVRIQNAFDLVAAEAKYHRNCAQIFLRNRDEKVKNTGRPTDKVLEEAFKKLCSFLDESDECQYSVLELVECMGTFLNGHDGCSIKTLKTKLKLHFGDDITITSINGKSSIVNLRDATHKILREKWNTDMVTYTHAESVL